MLDRKDLIESLGVGNIFHAEYPNGASCICLVLAVGEDSIQARRVTTQENLIFDRQTGVERDSNARSLATINSVTPLPAEIHDVFLDMDRKYQAFMAMDEKARFDQDPQRFKLTEAEKNAFRFIDTHYSANPLPAPVGRGQQGKLN
jgi:hypothetical protein